MLNIFTNNRIKIIFILLLTLFSVKVIAPNLFLADSPRINPIFIAKILNTPKALALLPSKILSSLSNFNLFKNRESSNTNTFVNVRQVTPPANVIFQSISTGVSAAEDLQTGEKYIKVQAGTKYKIVGYVTINGKQFPKIEFIK